MLSETIKKSPPVYTLNDGTDTIEIDPGIYETRIASHHHAILMACLDIFPDEWKLGGKGEPIFLGDPLQTSISSAVLFFGLGSSFFAHVFMCGKQEIILYGGYYLTEKSTAVDVAKNIDDLIATIEDGGENGDEA